MEFGDEHLRKFGIGDTVKIKDNLIVGKKYYTSEGKGDIFTSRMSENTGREGRIIEITYLGYKLDIDPIHTYTEDMLEIPRDTLAESDYEFNIDVERVLIQSQLVFYRRQIDKALDERMFETEPNKFNDLVEEYKEFFEKNKSILS